MENSPFNSSAIPEKPAPSAEGGDGKDKKASTKNKALGSIVFERADKNQPKSEERSQLSKLFGKPESIDALAKPDNVESADVAEATTETSPATAKEDQAATAESDKAAEFSEADAQYAAHEIAVERQAEVGAEPVAEDAESQAAHQAAQEFYDKIITEQSTPESAAATLLQELQPPQTAEAADVETEADDTAASQVSPIIAAGGAGSSPPPRRPGPGQANSQGPNTPPPTPNVPPAVPPGASMPATPNPNMAAAPITTRTEYVAYYDRSRAFSDMLVGGIVGYLIGRRRGRIKTERKLMPVQKKLEREVKSLKRDIAEKEFTIREAAKQRVREQAQANQLAPEQSISLHAQRAMPETVILSRREQSLRMREARQARPDVPPTERIGHVLVAAELVAGPAAEKLKTTTTPEKSPTATDKQSVEKQVETLSRNELLTLSEKVIVEGSTLRQVYETNLVSERGLRRLITEYLRGGDVVRAFRRELIEREIDFERDPKLRDAVRQNMRSSGSSSPTLQKLLAQAGVSTDDGSQQEIAKARADQLQQAKRDAKRTSNRKFVDISLMTVIAVLLAVIIVLLIHKY